MGVVSTVPGIQRTRVHGIECRELQSSTSCIVWPFHVFPANPCVISALRVSEFTFRSDCSSDPYLLQGCAAYTAFRSGPRKLMSRLAQGRPVLWGSASRSRFRRRPGNKSFRIWLLVSYLGSLPLHSLCSFRLRNHEASTIWFTEEGSGAFSFLFFSS